MLAWLALAAALRPCAGCICCRANQWPAASAPPKAPPAGTGSSDLDGWSGSSLNKADVLFKKSGGAGGGLCFRTVWNAENENLKTGRCTKPSGRDDACLSASSSFPMKEKVMPTCWCSCLCCLRGC